MKDTYGLSGDTHMMKNIEWGAVAYLTESKYGRNGTEVTKNTDSSYTTGGEAGNITKNKLQSSTGNEYGIYDLHGGAYEYVAGYIDNDEVKNSEYNDCLVKEADSKYKDVYAVGATDDIENNYQANKGMKGDAVYETSTACSGSNSWHGDYSGFPNTGRPVFERGGGRDTIGTNPGVFYFGNSDGYYRSYGGFRVVLIS